MGMTGAFLELSATSGVSNLHRRPAEALRMPFENGNDRLTNDPAR